MNFRSFLTLLHNLSSWNLLTLDNPLILQLETVEFHGFNLQF
jgi:hypothetical protein